MMIFSVSNLISSVPIKFIFLEVLSVILAFQFEFLIAHLSRVASVLILA